MKPYQQPFVGTIAPICPPFAVNKEVRDRILEVAECIAHARLSNTGDRGFSVFHGAASVTRETTVTQMIEGR